METRQAQTKTEIDFLPPFGQPEVVTTGNGAVDVAFAGILGAAAVSAISQD